MTNLPSIQGQKTLQYQLPDDISKNALKSDENFTKSCINSNTQKIGYELLVGARNTKQCKPSYSIKEPDNTSRIHKIECIIDQAMCLIHETRLTAAENILVNAISILTNMKSTDLQGLQNKAYLYAKTFATKACLYYKANDMEKFVEQKQNLIELKNNENTHKAYNCKIKGYVELSSIKYVDFFIAQILFCEGKYIDAEELISTSVSYYTPYKADVSDTTIIEEMMQHSNILLADIYGAIYKL